ncbi:MAG: MFS transporter [Nocardioidaceae bacterium]
MVDPSETGRPSSGGRFRGWPAACLVAFAFVTGMLGTTLLAGLGLSALSAAAFLMPTSLPWLFVGRGALRLLRRHPHRHRDGDRGRSAPRATAQARQPARRVGEHDRAGCWSGAVRRPRAVRPHPTRLVFVVDLGLVALGILEVLVVSEPVARAARPRLAPRPPKVPVEVRPTFVRAAIAGVAGFAVIGLFTALSPSFLGDVLHHHSPALVGVLVAVVFAGSILGQLLSTPLGLDRALSAGCGLLIVGAALIAVSLPTRSLALPAAVAVVLLVVGAARSGRTEPSPG